MVLNRFFKRIALTNSVFLILLLVCNSAVIYGQTDFQEKNRWEARGSNTEIIRDEYGVPHIFGKTDADAVFGLMYAHCEDDFPRIERNYIWAIGRLAEVEGESALYSDLRAQLFMTREEAVTEYEKCPEWLKTLCVAWADGINFYLAAHPEVTPDLLTRFEPWMSMYFTEGSIGGDIERVSVKDIKAFYEKDRLALASAFYDGYLNPKNGEPTGSNGFAISGKHTASGNAMLLINPHTSFFFRGEAHMQSEEGLNAYGAVTWGQFFIYQGFNEKNGWMHTSTGTDVHDEYLETIIKKDSGLYYQYGESLKPVTVLPISLKYKTTEGVKSKAFTGYRTHHGPVTGVQDEKWLATAIMWSPARALEQSYLRTKTKSYKAFNKMMDIRTNSSNNTVYADADGTIAYYHGNFIPVRDTAFNFKVPVDGSNPKTDWQGLHELSENISVVNPENGWIQNCNSTPFTCCGAYSPKQQDYPYYMTSFEENYRGIHAIALLKATNHFTLDKLIELAYDPFLPGAIALVERFKRIPVEKFDKSQRAAIKTLKKWDGKTSVKTKAMPLVNNYLLAFYAKGNIPKDKKSRMEVFQYINKEAPDDLCIAMMQEGMKQLEADFGSNLLEWGAINRYQRLDGAIHQDYDDNKSSIPIGLASGKWGALASFGAKRGSHTKRYYGYSGNSFVAVVEFGKKVQAKSLLAGGQSGHPDSPHFDDQVSLYADGKFKDVHFYLEDILKHVSSRYHPGKD